MCHRPACTESPPNLHEPAYSGGTGSPDVKLEPSRRISSRVITGVLRIRGHSRKPSGLGSPCFGCIVETKDGLVRRADRRFGRLIRDIDQDDTVLDDVGPHLSSEDRTGGVTVRQRRLRTTGVARMPRRRAILGRFTLQGASIAMNRPEIPGDSKCCEDRASGHGSMTLPSMIG